MILLTSNGLSDERLLDALRAHGVSGRAALVVTADNEYKEKNYHVARLTRELQTLGLQVECFDFDVQTPEVLAGYDVVELIGGNPYYLLRSVREHGFEPALRAVAEERVLIGCSAGALVLTPTLALIDRITPEMNVVGLRDLSACHLTEVQILPHYGKLLRRYEGLEELCRRYEREQGCAVLRLNDGEGVLVDRGSVQRIE
jgi:peptidase E